MIFSQERRKTIPFDLAKLSNKTEKKKNKVDEVDDYYYYYISIITNPSAMVEQKFLFFFVFVFIYI